MENNKYFPDINEGRKLAKQALEGLSNKVKTELISRLYKRIERNMNRGELYLMECTENFSVVKTKHYIKAINEVEEILRNEGYHVESYLEDYNGCYYNITMLICWDIEALKADTYSYSNYKKYRDGDLISKNIVETL